MTLKELLDRKSKAVKEWRALNDEIEKAGGIPTAEQSQQSDHWEQEIDKAQADIDSYNIQQDRKRRLLEAEASLQEPANAHQSSLVVARGTDGAEAVVDRRPFPERFRDHCLTHGLNRQQAVAHFATAVTQPQKERAAWNQWLLGNTNRVEWNGAFCLQQRAGLQMDVDASGGFLVAPEQFVARLIQDMDRAVFVRSIATVIPLVGAESLGVPTLDTDISDTNWTTELAIGTMDTSMLFGKRRLTPHPLAKPIKVSKDLMRSAALSPEAIVRERMLFKFGTVQEAAFMTGTGAGQPLGVFTASSAGISTGQDVSTGNTTTSIQTDGLIEAKYKLELQWLSSANLRWVFHRDAIKQIRKLKDGDGQYILSPGIQQDTTDRILGVPVAGSEFAPNTFTTGLYVGIIGDFSYYWIADAMSVEIQRLVELYAATNEDGFHGRMKLDGMPVLEKAFARVKLA